jgi:hypothetical protein
MLCARGARAGVRGGPAVGAAAQVRDEPHPVADVEAAADAIPDLGVLGRTGEQLRAGRVPDAPGHVVHDLLHDLHGVGRVSLPPRPVGDRRVPEIRQGGGGRGRGQLVRILAQDGDERVVGDLVRLGDLAEGRGEERVGPVGVLDVGDEADVDVVLAGERGPTLLAELGAAELEELAEALPGVFGGPDDGPSVCHAVPFCTGKSVPRLDFDG